MSIAADGYSVIPKDVRPAVQSLRQIREGQRLLLLPSEQAIFEGKVRSRKIR